MISVIIPVHNGEKTIEACISSLQEQSFNGKYEIIVVDDGSKDRTRDIINKLNCTLIMQGKKGPASARNLGAKQAKGNIILFTDADCVPDKTWIGEMAKPFDDKNIAGVQGVYRTIQKSLTARFAQEEIEQRYDKMRKRQFIDFIGTYSAGYRKEIFLEFRGFDEKFPTASGEDPDLSYRIAEKEHKMVLNEKAIVFHKHPSTLQKYLKVKFFRAYYRVRLYSKHKNKIVNDSYTPNNLKIQILLFYGLVSSVFLGLFIHTFFYLTAVSAVLLIASTLPFTAKAIKKNFVVGLMSPIILILRTAVFCTGLIAGALKL